MKIIITILLFITIRAVSQTNFDDAEKLFKQNKFEQAESIFESLLIKNPESLKILEYLGETSGKLQQWDKCIFYFNKLKNLKPNEANYYYKYGGGLGMKASQNRNLSSIKFVEEAKVAFEKTIIINPNHIEARYALIRIYTELPGFLGGSYKKANIYADELLKISKVDGYIAKGSITEHQKNYQQAEANYIMAYKISRSKVAYQRLYNLYITKLKDLDKVKALEKV